MIVEGNSKHTEDGGKSAAQKNLSDLDVSGCYDDIVISPINEIISEFAVCQ